jgi:hypothetical protein
VIGVTVVARGASCSTGVANAVEAKAKTAKVAIEVFIIAASDGMEIEKF